MLTKLFEALYIKVFVNIIVSRTTTEIYIEEVSNGIVKNSSQNSYETTDVTLDMVNFISRFTKETPYYYVSIIDTSKEQGSIPTCEKNRLSYYYYDIEACESKSFNDIWTFYTQKSELYALEKKFKKVGLDFIFSPFVILNNFFKDKITSHIAMYILIQDGSISLSVYAQAELLFAEHLDLSDLEDDEILLSQDENESDNELEFFEEEGIDLEDIDVEDDLDDLEAFGDIEDLDSFEEIEDFSEHKDLEEEFHEANEEVNDSQSEEESISNEDYERFSLIKNSLGNYYSDNKYDSQFIENVYIADSISVSSDLKRYLEEDMFLNVYIRRLDMNSEMLELVKMELNI